MLRAKLHGATITDSNILYEGSITLGEDLLKASGMLRLEKVDIYNITNGNRFSTYIIAGKEKEVIINGAAARLVQKNDKIIVCAYCQLSENETEAHRANVVSFKDSENTIKDVIQKR